MWESALTARDLALQTHATERNAPLAPAQYGPLDVALQQKLLAGSAALHNGLHLPSRNGPQGENADAAWITPNPRFVIKAKLKDGKKIFLNLCGNEKVEPWHYKELIMEDQGSTTDQKGGVRVPMSIGPCQC